MATSFWACLKQKRPGQVSTHLVAAAGLLTGLLAIGLSPRPGPAQDVDRAQATMRMGYGFPLAELNEFLEQGPSLWVGARYRLTRSIAVLVEGGRSYLNGDNIDDRQTPTQRFETPTRLQHLLVGTELALAPFDVHPEGMVLRVTGGRVSYSTNPPFAYDWSICARPPRANLLEEAWTVGLGGRISYEVRESVKVSFTTDFIGAFQERDDEFLGPGGFPCPEEKKLVRGFGFPMTVPLTVGVNVGF